MAVALGGGAVGVVVVQQGQGSAITCLVSNYQSWGLGGVEGQGKPGCVTNTLVIRNNTAFQCSGPLSNFGPLPLKVRGVWTVSDATADGAYIDNGCIGDGSDDTIDIVFELVDGNGDLLDGNDGLVGPQNDSFKFRQNPGANHIQVTGRFECGARGPVAHQDIIQYQMQTGVNSFVWIVNGTSGDYNAGHSTCQGAGGIIYTGGSGIHLLGGEYIACNTTLAGGGTLNTVENVKFRSGRAADASEPNCAGLGGGTNPCGGSAFFDVFTGNICQQWQVATDTWANVTPN